MVELLDSEKEDESEEELIRFDLPREAEKVSGKQVAPWMTSRTRDIKDSLLRFHNEVIEFCEYVSPTKEEHTFREKALAE